MSHWWPILIGVLCRLSHLFFSHFLNWSVFSSILSVSQTSCVTVTQGPCNVSSSLGCGHCTLLFLYGSLTIQSCYYLVWNTFFDSFSSIFSVQLSYSPGVTQGFYNVILLSQSRHAGLILLFVPLLTCSQSMFCELSNIFPR